MKSNMKKYIENWMKHVPPSKENYSSTIRVYSLSRWWHRFIPGRLLPYFVPYSEIKGAYPKMVSMDESLSNSNTIEPDSNTVEVTFQYEE